ncbi:MAG: IS701 family transposase [Sciscionella sp.]
MLRGLTLPGTLSRVLVPFRPCFTAPSFEVFTALVTGLLAQPVGRTVCGILTGAGLARVWHHCRAHRFFSTARWQPRHVGLVLAEVIVTQLLGAREAITVVLDDTLFRRRGKKVHGVGWFHDGSATSTAKLGFGNNWVVAAIIVTVPFVSRPVALPVLAALAVKGGRTKPDLARDLVDLLAERFTEREVNIVADAAYGCGAFMGLGHDMSMTTRARTTSVFYHLAPPRTGRRGRPRRKGDRIGTPTDIATSARWKTVSVARYGTRSTVQITERTCLWYGTWRTDTVRVILVRDTTKHTTTTTTGSAKGYDIALITTDLAATPEQVIARYAARWSIEVTFFDVKNILGVGQARNRVRKAVERTVPFGLFCHSLLILWYTQHGHAATDVAHRRASAPWYTTKTEPSTLDMLTTLRRHIIAARFLPPSPRPATTQEILEVQHAWALAAA